MVLLENRPDRRDRFEALPVEMVGQFACDLVESVEVAVEVVAAVVCTDETTVAKSLEDSVDRIAVVVALRGDPGDGSRLIEIIQNLKGLAGQQLWINENSGRIQRRT